MPIDRLAQPRRSTFRRLHRLGPRPVRFALLHWPSSHHLIRNLPLAFSIAHHFPDYPEILPMLPHNLNSSDLTPYFSESDQALLADLLRLARLAWAIDQTDTDVPLHYYLLAKRIELRHQCIQLKLKFASNH